MNSHPTDKNKKKILYLAVNASYSHSSLAYGQLRAVAERENKDWDWDILECINKDNLNDMLLLAQGKSPDVLISTVYLFNRRTVLDFINKFKTLVNDCKVLLGGPEFLGDNEAFMKQNSYIDFIVRGDESSFSEVLNGFSYWLGSSRFPLDMFKSIKGICFLSNDGDYIDGGKAELLSELDSLNSPYTYSYYSRKKPFLQIETSRGCCSICSFCTSSTTNGTTFYSASRVKNDLRTIYRNGIREVRILDRTFNEDSSRAAELIQIFSDEFPDVNFHLEVDPSRLTKIFVEALEKTKPGQLHIEVGVQSLSPAVLKSIRRKSNLSSLTDGLKKLCSISSIEVHADLIAGLPEQTFDIVLDDLYSLTKIGPDEIQLELLKILPGTFIEQNPPLEFKWSMIPPYEIMSTANFSFKELIKISYLSKIVDSFYNVPSLRKLVEQGIRHNKYFYQNFLDLVEGKLIFAEKPSIANRFKMFFEYAAGFKNRSLLEFSIFTAFSAGMIHSPLNNIQRMRKEYIRQLFDDSKVITLWESGDVVLEKHAYITNFSYNVGDIWMNPDNKYESGEFKYLFMLSQGGMSKKIAKICMIRSDVN